jgi:hypothetical protein
LQLNFKAPSLRCLITHDDGPLFHEFYHEHIKKRALCVSIPADEVKNQKYNVSLPCGEYFAEFSKTQCEAHLEKCDVCRKKAQAEVFPLSLLEQAIIHQKMNHASKKELEHSWKTLGKQVQSVKTLIYYNKPSMRAVSWRFQQPQEEEDDSSDEEADSNDEAVTFMAFEVDATLWRVFTLCVEKFLTKSTQRRCSRSIIESVDWIRNWCCDGLFRMHNGFACAVVYH